MRDRKLDKVDLEISELSEARDDRKLEADELRVQLQEMLTQLQPMLVNLQATAELANGLDLLGDLAPPKLVNQLWDSKIAMWKVYICSCCGRAAPACLDKSVS